MPITQLRLDGIPGRSTFVGEKPITGPFTRISLSGHIGIRYTPLDIPPIIPDFDDEDSGIPSPLSPAIEDAGPWTRFRWPQAESGPDEDDYLDTYGRHQFALEYNGTTVYLPSPLIGDEQTLESILVNRRTRGGKARVYKSPSWYTLHIYTYTFKHVREEIKDDFLTLVRNAMADPIKVIDHLDQVYEDMYIAEVGPVTEEHDDGCSYTFDLTLQVVR